MLKFLIERDVPGAGQLTDEEIRDGARESNAVIRELGAEDLQWVRSYVTEDQIYCVYIAESEDILHEHARCIDLPATRISRVVQTTDPSTGAQNGP